MPVAGTKSAQKSKAAAKNAKIRKKERKIRKNIAMKIRRHKLGFVAVLSVCVVICVIFVNIWANIGEILSRDEKIAELQQEYNHRRIQNDALEQKVEAAVDDEYVEEIAREQGYRKSDEIIFYLH
jgi:cell division protein FtsB